MAISEFAAEEINLKEKKVVNKNDNRVVVEDETSPVNLRDIMRRDPNKMRETKTFPLIFSPVIGNIKYTSWLTIPTMQTKITFMSQIFTRRRNWEEWHGALNLKPNK